MRRWRTYVKSTAAPRQRPAPSQCADTEQGRCDRIALGAKKHAGSWNSKNTRHLGRDCQVLESRSDNTAHDDR